MVPIKTTEMLKYVLCTLRFQHEHKYCKTDKVFYNAPFLQCFFHTCVASSQRNVPLESIKRAIYSMSKYLSISARQDGTSLQACCGFARLHKRVRCSKDFTEIR